jgi:hypothetical protein
MAYKHTCIACGSPCGYTGIFDSADCSNKSCKYAEAEKLEFSGYVQSHFQEAEDKYEAVYRLFEAAERFRYTPKCPVGHEEDGDLPSWCPECQKIEQAGDELFSLIEAELGAKARNDVPNP